MKNFFRIGLLTLLMVGVPMAAEAFTAVELKEAAFSYRPEAGPYYALESQTIRNRNNGTLTRKQAFELYQKLDACYPLEQDLNSWDAANGVSPLVIRVRAKVKNYGNEASKEIPVKITLWGKLGEFYVNPRTLLVDELYLKRSAQWTLLETQSLTIPILGNNEWYTLLSRPIPLGGYWLTWKNRFPVALKAQVQLPTTGASKTFEIPVYPGPFAVAPDNL